MNTHCSSHTVWFLCMYYHFTIFYGLCFEFGGPIHHQLWTLIGYVRRYWGVLVHHLHLSEQILPSGERQPTPWTEDSIEQTTIHTHTPICLSPDTRLWTMEGSHNTRKRPWPERDLNPGLWVEPGIPAQNTQARGEHAHHCTPKKLTAADLQARVHPCSWLCFMSSSLSLAKTCQYKHTHLDEPLSYSHWSICKKSASLFPHLFLFSPTHSLVAFFCY